MTNLLKCARCNREYEERQDDEDDIAHYLCSRCRDQYLDIRDFYEKERYRITKEEGQALWDFILSEKECKNDKGKSH